jgi:hypothetical protein
MASQRIYESKAHKQAAYRSRVKQAHCALAKSKGLPASPHVPNIAGWARWTTAMRQIGELLELVESEMKDYYEKRSERWLESDAAEAFEERLDQIRDFADQLPDWS